MAFLHRFDEFARHGEGDVGLEQGDAHFAQGGFDVVLGKGALFRQPVEDTGKAIAQILKHLFSGSL